MRYSEGDLLYDLFAYIKYTIMNKNKYLYMYKIKIILLVYCKYIFHLIYRR